MPFAVILEALKAGASIAIEFFKTWIGGFVLAALIAWPMGVHWEYRRCAKREAAAEAERVRIGLIEHQRRDEAIAKARKDAEAAEAALHSQMEEHARYMVEIEYASKANDRNPCLNRAGVVRLNKIGARRKKAP